jgi:general secretion pathway protein J
MNLSFTCARRRGFTLIELLVALAVMSLIALLSWRGVDSMVRVQTGTRQHLDGVLTLQAGLNQWTTDLDALFETEQVPALDYDGKVLRLTRRDTVAADSPVRVVGWTLRQAAGPDGFQNSWVRWQSSPLRTRSELHQAWTQVQRWARQPDVADTQREVAIVGLVQWQLFYHRGGAWSHPLSSASPSNLRPIAGTAEAPALAGLPDGVRLVLTLPAGQPMAGLLLKDWAAPAAGGKS